MLNFTAAASQGSPLWKVTPGRSRKRQTRGDTAFQDSARRGAGCCRGPAPVRVSNMLIRAFIEIMSPCFCGSMVLGSPVWETRRTLPAPAAGVGAAAGEQCRCGDRGEQRTAVPQDRRGGRGGCGPRPTLHVFVPLNNTSVPADGMQWG